MMRRMNHLLTVAAATVLAYAGAAHAAINWSENWTGYASNNNVPNGAWQLRGIDANDTDSITTAGGQVWLHNTEVGGLNPQLVLSLPVATGALITEPVDISFTYRIKNPSNSQILFTVVEYLDGNRRDAVRMLLGQNYQGQTSAYYDGTGTRQAFGPNFVSDETVTINLKNINRSTGTYTIEWISSRGTYTTNATFRNSGVANFGEIWIGESSGDASVSDLYVGPVTIKSSAVPEAASVALLAAAVPFLLVRRSKK